MITTEFLIEHESKMKQARDTILDIENENGGREDREPDLDRIEWNLLKTMDKRTLRELRDELQDRQSSCYTIEHSYLIDKINRAIDWNPHDRRVSAPQNNETLAILLRGFTQQCSGKKCECRKKLRLRYAYQSNYDQKKILSAMFSSKNKIDKVWAVKKLGNAWDKKFESDVIDTLRLTKDKVVAAVCLRYLPASLLLENLSYIEATEIQDYRIFSILGNEPGFPYEITIERLGPGNYIYVMASLGRKLSEEDSWKCLAEHLIEKITLAARSYLNGDIMIGLPGGLIYFPDMTRIIWALSELGHTGVLCRLIHVILQVRSFEDNQSEDPMTYFKSLSQALYSVDGLFSTFELPTFDVCNGEIEDSFLDNEVYAVSPYDDDLPF